MDVVVSSKAEKYIKRMNNPYRQNILDALDGLEKEPPQGDIKQLQGIDGFRLRVGNYRVLFHEKDNTIIITQVTPRGDAYKGGR
jgi:mRNA interferase RelE/StbE